MMITCISDLSTEATHEQVVAMDGDLTEVLPLIAQTCGIDSERIVGVIVDVDKQVAFFQNMPHAIHLEAMSSLAELRDRDAEMVVVGPTALLGCLVEDVVLGILRQLPGARIVCATGLRNDLSPC